MISNLMQSKQKISNSYVNLKLDTNKVLMILGDKNEMFIYHHVTLKSKVVTADSVNTFDVLNAQKVVMLKFN